MIFSSNFLLVFHLFLLTLIQKCYLLHSINFQIKINKINRPIVSYQHESQQINENFVENIYDKNMTITMTKPIILFFQTFKVFIFL